MCGENLERTLIFDFKGCWRLSKYPPENPGYYMTIRCGLSGIYTHLDEFKNGHWQIGITDDSSVIAYQKDPVPIEEVNEWCKAKLQKYHKIS